MHRKGEESDSYRKNKKINPERDVQKELLHR
jgi:hypothetical protein